MLNIAKLAPRREEYYLAQVVEGREDYYLDVGEAAGRWVGSSGAELGLVGEVAGDDLRAVLAGRSPAGEALARASRKVPGFDLTFRAPKSVSLLHALCESDVRSQVREAHDAAVCEALVYLETHACSTRRGPRGIVSVKGEGFVAAGFRHRTSRNADPLLHTHVLVANLVKADGRWGALDGRLLYGESRTAGFVYQAVLRTELTERLGVDWQPVHHGVADIAGVPPGAIRAFSTRRSEILTELDHRGEHSAAAAQIATLATRKTKTPRDHRQLVAEWHERAEAHGLTRQVLRSVLHRTSAERVGMPAVDGAVLVGPNGITRQRSTFTRRDVVQAWCEQLPHGAHHQLIETLTDETLASDEVLGLQAGELDAQFAASLHRRDGAPIPSGLPGRFTTREMAATERSLVTAAETAVDTGVGVVPREVVDAALRLRPTLAPEQRDMIRRLTGDGNGIDVVIGKAGAGKTLALDAARAAWQSSGHTIIGCALAARAAAQLQSDAGIPSATIHRLQLELARHPLPADTVVVVDEAAMVGTRQLAHLAALTQRAGAKLVLVGDDRQLPAIDAGGGFRALSKAIDPIRLDVNRRQHHDWERVALDQLATGRTSVALDAYRQHGRITSAPTAENAREQLVTDWLTHRLAGGDGPMIALHRSDVDDLNHRARHHLAAAGQLTGQPLHVGDKSFAVGDQVIGRRNNYRAGILNGTRGAITNIQHRAGTLTIATAEGEQLHIPRSYLDRGHLDHAYAITIHKTQGATFDRAFVLGDDRLYREAGYVALSRATDSTQLYTVAADPSDEHLTYQHAGVADQLARTLQNSRAEVSIRELTLGP